MLCQNCSGFSIASIRSKDYAHHTSLEALTQSADKGCYLCTLFYDAFNIDALPEPSLGIDTYKRLWVEDYSRWELCRKVNEEGDYVIMCEGNSRRTSLPVKLGGRCLLLQHFPDDNNCRRIGCFRYNDPDWMLQSEISTILIV